MLNNLFLDEFSMAHSFWSRLFPWIRRDTNPAGEKPVPVEVGVEQVRSTLVEEFRGLRKMVRKQGQVLEELHGLQARYSPSVKGGTDEGLITLATAFFHLHQSLVDRLADSPAHREAMALFWLQLDRGLHEIDVRMIREKGAPFDARLHRAVLSRGTGTGEWVVAEVLEPGYIRGETVSTPAKVILGHSVLHQLEDKDHQ
ncbi:nucleotide exchange factor GrpE [Desulfobulbus propionicus]